MVALSVHDKNKQALVPLRAALYDYELEAVENAVLAIMAPEAIIHLAHPFEDLNGSEGLIQDALIPLFNAMPDAERRDLIVMAGHANGADWVGCGGHYTGTFIAPFLDIPPTGHQAAMRFHEFYRFEEGCIVEMQALWDIPELMMQAGVWPMPPTLGREWHVPGPATCDGLVASPHNENKARASVELVGQMLASLGNFATGGVAAMELDRFWHPKFSWYGPSGIGTGRGIRGFRHWHQIPFLNAMPDRVGSLGQGFLFGDGDYVGFTAWPGMHATISNDGWMGIAPSGQKITMRSLDFWRCENGKIRENWVLVDLLDVYHQIGVDVLSRMREISGATRVPI